MVSRVTAIPPELYEADETAWLDAMVALLDAGRASDLDFPNLREYLHDMARSERREVVSRVVVLLAHILKWEFQPDKRSGSWRATIRHQRFELRQQAEGVLRNHAEENLPRAYASAVEEAMDETGLSADSFPAECPYTLDQLLADDLPI